MPVEEKMEWKDRAKLVDLSDKGLFAGETVELDFNADAWIRPTPPPMGIYDLKLFPAKDTYHMVLRDESKGADAPGNVYYTANLECRIVSNNPEYDNYPCFTMVNTLVGRGREISTMMGLVRLTGATPKTNKLNDLQQAVILREVLKKEPVVRGVFLDWEGYSKNDKKSVCRSMTDFPKDQDGKFQSTFTRTDSNRDKEEITAQLRIKAWVSKGQTVGNQDHANQAMVSAQETQAPLAPSQAPIPPMDDLESLLA
jgi:hypothetical protein